MFSVCLGHWLTSVGQLRAAYLQGDIKEDMTGGVGGWVWGGVCVCAGFLLYKGGLE